MRCGTLLCSRLIALPKEKKQAPAVDRNDESDPFFQLHVPSHDIRPIAVGEAMWKLVAVTALGRIRDKLPHLFPRVQLGVGQGGCAEAACIAIQAALDAD